jgi:hypothetical protein
MTSIITNYIKKDRKKEAPLQIKNICISTCAADMLFYEIIIITRKRDSKI